MHFEIRKCHYESIQNHSQLPSKIDQRCVYDTITSQYCIYLINLPIQYKYTSILIQNLFVWYDVEKKNSKIYKYVLNLL